MTFLLGESTNKEMIAIAEKLNFINQTAYAYMQRIMDSERK